jgi:hypothetical protein
MPVRVECLSRRGDVTCPRIRAMRPHLSLPDASCDISMCFSTGIVIHVDSGTYASSYSKYQVSIEAMVESGNERYGQEMFITYHITHHTNLCGLSQGHSTLEHEGAELQNDCVRVQSLDRSAVGN